MEKVLLIGSGQHCGVVLYNIEAQGSYEVVGIDQMLNESHAIANELSGLSGVMNVNLIYLNFEDDKTIYPDGV